MFDYGVGNRIDKEWDCFSTFIGEPSFSEVCWNSVTLDKSG